MDQEETRELILTSQKIEATLLKLLVLEVEGAML